MKSPWVARVPENGLGDQSAPVYLSSSLQNVSEPVRSVAVMVSWLEHLGVCCVCSKGVSSFFHPNSAAESSTHNEIVVDL